MGSPSSVTDGFVEFTLDSSHPFYVHPSDSPSSQLVAIPFNETGLVARKVPQPPPNSPYYPYWERCNDMVKAWIINSLTRKIAVIVICLNTVREVCSDINERFGQSNGSKYIQIQREIGSNSQGSSDIATYFTRMRALWDKLNSAYVGPTCSCGALPKFIEDQHLFQFLSGLNESYSTINSSIMLMSPLPSISKAYSLLQHDESQKENQPPALGFSGDSASFSTTTTNSTHVNQMNSPHNTRPYNQRINFDPKRNSPSVSCKYCKKPGHTIDKCYRLHGFPADFKFTKNKRFASCVQVEEPADDIGPSIKSSDSTAYGFSKEQYQHLMSLFQQTHISPGIHSSPSDENIGYAKFAVYHTPLVPFVDCASTPSPPSFSSAPLSSSPHSPPTYVPPSATSLPTSPLLRKSSRVCHTPPYLKDYVCSSALSNPVSGTSKVSPVELQMHESPFYQQAASNPAWYKARLVIRCDTQKEDIDYTETFSPVVKFTTIKCLLSLAAKKDWTVYQLDVNNAFLHGDLHEEVCMKLSPGLQISTSAASDSSPLVCKLNKSLYGLKQASRQWFSKLFEAMLSRGYISSKNDYSLFTKSSNSSLTVLVVYVNDILLAGDDVAELDNLQYFLDSQFKIKYLGSVHYFLGLEVTKNSQGYLVSQQKFASDLLDEFNCMHFTPVVTPLESSIKLTFDMGQPLTDPSFYRILVGKLNFLQYTRPDIAFSVQHLSQFLQAPQVPHMLSAIHVLRYLMNAPEQGILLSKSPVTSLVAYSDSDWAACTESQKFVTGFFISFGGCPISWKCKKQHIISLSYAEAEYRALRKVVAEISWLVFCDSQAALHIAKNPVFHERTKHIDIDCHFVRDCLQTGLISLHHISTTDQPADILTKSLAGPLHHHLLGKLGVASPSSLRGGGGVGLSKVSDKKPNRIVGYQAQLCNKSP
uniref:Reverse transcriptase Ty1/copia-type domain-containing protein n=1 Tax=Nicotiana tabacum TaxID=4097 RepID=A0A1S4CI88_TOBAC|nr:PREDICTED: uncharacterized protein LOC107819297 [Nicotiana tabacum]